MVSWDEEVGESEGEESGLERSEGRRVKDEEGREEGEDGGLVTNETVEKEENISFGR